MHISSLLAVKDRDGWQALPVSFPYGGRHFERAPTIFDAVWIKI